MSKVVCFFISFIFFTNAFGQRYWEEVPTPTTPVIDRYNDISIVNDRLAYACNFDSLIIRTIDGGTSWQTINKPRGTNFRAICFLDSLTGFVSKLSTSNVGVQDTGIIYKTSDGGNSWNQIILPGSRPYGICGMNKVNDSIIYAVGRYNGPPRFYKSVDKGLTWMFKDLSSVANGGVVDVHFFSPDTGVVCGSVGNYPTGAYDSSAVVLYTTDGGNNWTRVMQTYNGREMAWKISFPSRLTGYVSLQQGSGNVRTFLKTTDGGVTWQEFPYAFIIYNSQGIGFANDTLGWIGGKCCGGDPTVFRTEDGGISWVEDTVGQGLNRMRFHNGKGMAAGYPKMYKYPKSGLVKVDGINKSKVVRTSRSNDLLLIEVEPHLLSQNNEVFLFDMTGKDMISSRLISSRMQFDLSQLAAGVYVLNLNSNGHTLYTEKVVVAK